MIYDLKLIVYSYLNLEETLTFFKDDLTFRDKLIQKNHKTLPYIDKEFVNGNLETIKYLIEEKKVVTMFSTLVLASYHGHLEVVKYLCNRGCAIISDAIDYASKNGHIEVVKYLIEKRSKNI